MKAYVEAYGCTLNFGESREIEEALSVLGWDLVEAPDGADLAVLVTCVVVEKTERAMVKRLKELSSAPRLIVTGCMATAFREKAEAVAPEAEFSPPGDVGSVAALAGSGSKPGAVLARPPGSYAIVPVATGCKGTCSYCITRLARGPLRSRSPDSIIANVRSAVSTGPREIRLTAQDTAAYGSDVGTNLPDLVRGICSVNSDFRLRIGMMNPASVLPILDDVIGMYREPKVFKFMHLPVQSGSDRLLRDMERGYTVDDFHRVVSETRSQFPDISLSTDLIVGYPGEEPEDHRANMELVAKARPDIVNVTRFSPRPGTKAAGSGKAVAGGEAKGRSREITELRFRIALEMNRSWVGKRVRALATEPGKKGSTILRTEEYRQIVVPGELNLGSYYDVTVTDATPTYLIGGRGCAL